MSDSIVLDNSKKADMTRETKIINCPFCKCGQSTDSKRLDEGDRIVGGEEAQPHSFPWSVSLRVSWGTYFCGGAILDEKVSFESDSGKKWHAIIFFPPIKKVAKRFLFLNFIFYICMM